MSSAPNVHSICAPPLAAQHPSVGSLAPYLALCAGMLLSHS
ncbi:hypothetical protein ACP70R_000275 [Stipagrostis hirtigluma subsp. patula]